MDRSDTLALAALIVALFALLNTLSQVLQQYLLTADGFRRCSASVMGEWARFTRRRFKWRELRFETVFATPVIFLEVAYELRNLEASQTSIVVLDGTEEMFQWPGLKVDRGETSAHKPAWSIYGMLDDHYKHVANLDDAVKRNPGWMDRILRRSTTSSVIATLASRTSSLRSSCAKHDFGRMDSNPNGQQLENESVSWIPLMRSLQGYTSSLRMAGLSVFQDASSGSSRHGRILAPAVRLRKQSWDFMPPEVTKPYAVSTIRDLAILVQLLGLQWTNFKPEDGVIRAEGPGIVVTSTEVRSLGTLISFVKTDERIERRRQLHGVVFSPMEGAAALGFGMINSDLLAESYRIYSAEDCYDTIIQLGNIEGDITGLPHSVLETIVTDLLGMLTPALRPVSTGITFLVRPSSLLNEGGLSLRGCLEEFTTQLERVLESNTETKHLLQQAPFIGHIRKYCRSILEKSRWRREFGLQILGYHKYNDPNVLALLDHLHLACSHTTSWLSSHKIHCRRILREHLRAQLASSQNILHIQRQNPLRWPEALAQARHQLISLHFDTTLEKCIKALDGELDSARVMEIWVGLLFRAICWHAIHNFDEKVVAVAPRYHDSNLPVYIA